jgi:hypothetical protein
MKLECDGRKTGTFIERHLGEVSDRRGNANGEKARRVPKRSVVNARKSGVKLECNDPKGILRADADRAKTGHGKRNADPPEGTTASRRIDIGSHFAHLKDSTDRANQMAREKVRETVCVDTERADMVRTIIDIVEFQ